jgi:hypothetical protein
MQLGIDPTKQGTTKKEIPPAGMHLGLLFRVIDAGWCHNEFNGVKSLKTKVRLDFELWPLGENNEYTLMESGKPFCVSPGFQGWLTLGKYTEIMNSWRGSENPDVETFLGQPALLNIKYTEGKPKDGVTAVYANVTAVNPIMRGMFIPEMVNPPLVYSVKAHDQELFLKLPKWIQDWIARESDSFSRLQKAESRTSSAEDPGPDQPYGAPPSDDDIPF